MTTSTLISPNKYSGRTKPIRLLVLHTTESAEVSNGAELNARYFHNDKVNASAHVVGDNDSTVRVVEDVDTAWTTPGVNSESLNYELVGLAGQDQSNWDDPYSVAAIDLAAHQFAEWARLYHIPIRRLSQEELLNGDKGIIGHVDASLAYRKSTHTDPGNNFPWTKFLLLVAKYAGVAEVTPPPQPKPPTSITVDGIWGAATTKKAQQVIGTKADGIISNQPARLPRNNPGLSTGWDYTGDPGDGGSNFIRHHQAKLKERGHYKGTIDGKAGPLYFAALQRDLGTPVDGFVSRPSAMVTAFQKRLNQGRI